MRVLHLASEYPPQKVFGLGRFVHDLAVEQARQGHEVHVITNSLSGRDREIVDKGVHVHRVDFPPPPKPPDDGATVTQFNVQLIERVFRDRICPDADVVNAHDWLTALAGRVVSRRLGVPFAVTIHDVVVGKKFGELDNDAKYVGNIEHWMCHEADLVICVSEHTRDEVIREYGASAKKTFAIHNAVSEESFPVPELKLLARFRRVLASEDEPIILYVGRLDREKGVDVLLQAFARVVADGARAKLVVAGKGMLDGGLRKQATELGAEHSVVFAGYVAQPVLNCVYRSAEALVVPSLYEPFGIVAVEGMICGLPVIASATGGLTEVVEDEETGLLVPPGDVEALADGLRRMLLSPSLRERLGGRGKRRARETFSWANVAARIAHIYRPSSPATTARILFDGQQLARQMTGVGHYTERVLQAMLRLDSTFEWVVLCHRGNVDYVERVLHEHSNARTFILTEPVPLDYRFQQAMLDWVVPKVGADLYFSPCFLSARRDTCPSVSVVHDVTYVLHPEFLPRGVAEYLHGCVGSTCQNASRVIAISENSLRDIARTYTCAEGKIVTVPLAADDDFFLPRPQDAVEQVRLKYGLPERYVLAVNMGNPKKNAPLLLRAFAQVGQDVRTEWKLVIAGEWNAELLDLRVLAEEAGLAEDVILTDYVPGDDLRALYAGAGLFCFPSIHEGFGLPVLEAMASCVPVLCSDAASLPEVGGDAAFFVDPHDEEGWVVALSELLGQEERRQELGACGKKHAARFSWEQTAQMTLSILTEVLQETGSSLLPASPSEVRSHGSQRNSRTILFISRQPLTDLGGAERSAATILTHLQDHGYDCHAVWPGNEDEPHGEPFTVHRVPDADAVASVADSVAPSLIFSQLHWASLSVQIAKEHEIPSVLFLRSFEPFCLDPVAYVHCDRRCERCASFGRHSSFLNAQRRSLQEATTVVANSRYMASVLREFTGREPPVVYPPIDFETVYASESSRECILMVSPLPHKGGATFFEVARRMPGERFLCAGCGDAPPLPNVEHIGRVDPRSFYSRAKLLLVPSLMPEAFGRVVPEAMSNGVPVIASNIGGLPEAVGAGGVVMNNYTDVPSWVEAVRYVLDETVYARYSGAARQQASRFEPGPQIQTLLGTLEDCHA